MGTVQVAALNEVADLLSQQSANKVTCVEYDELDDIVPAVADYALTSSQDVQQITIVCPDDIAAEAYISQISGCNSDLGDRIAVYTLKEFCFALLSNDTVPSDLKRGLRILDANEIDVLLEDVKVTGLKPGRLREMLKFLYRGMSDGSDKTPNWLLSSEEKNVYSVLMENLESRESALPYELSSLTLSAVEQNQGIFESDVVIAHDFGALSKQSQALLKSIASQKFIAIASRFSGASYEESYPCHEGFEQLCEEADCVISVQNHEIGPEKSFSSYVRLQDEIDHVVENVSNLVQQGVSTSSIVVAVPNAQWGNRIATMLNQGNIETRFDMDAAKVKGDPRYPDKIGDLKYSTFLKLCAHPADHVALRSWLGLGDWLLRSDAFLELLAYAKTEGVNAFCALDDLYRNPDKMQERVVCSKFIEPLHELYELQQSVAHCESGKQAAALLIQHGMNIPQKDLDRLNVTTGNVREALAAMAQDAKVLQQGNDGVLITTHRRCRGRHIDYVFACGLVNGYLPALDAVDDKYTIDHRRTVLERERAVFYDMYAAAGKRFACSAFETEELEQAVRMRIETTRVFVKHGKQMARIAPTEFSSLCDEVFEPKRKAPSELPTKVMLPTTM